MITYKRYRQLADQSGMTDYKVAKLAGFRSSKLSDWKAGRYCPKTDTIYKICQVIGADLEEMYGYGEMGGGLGSDNR